MDNEIPRDGEMEEQYVQDLPVVVLQNKEWGSYRNVAGDMAQSEEKNTWLNDFAADIQIESIQLQYFSGDKQAKLQNDQVYKYGIEYSGIKHTGERVMGLSLIDPCQPVTKPDDILTWVVPKDWSLEDAATVPFHYTLAYYMLDNLVIQHQEDIDSILINICNESLLCEACIAISLSRNQTVYVTVADNSEAAYIKNRYPQGSKSWGSVCFRNTSYYSTEIKSPVMRSLGGTLRVGSKNHIVLVKLDDKQILNMEGCSLEVEVLKVTNGEKVDLVVNSSVNIEDVADSLNCTREHGFLLQIGQTNKWETQDIGMFPFAQSVSFITIPNRISSLLKLPKSDKKVLKGLIEDGIKTGIVVPFDKSVQLQGIPETNSKLHVKNIFKWISNNDLCHNTTEKLRYDNKRSYIIVGDDKTNKFWFELVEWLFSKGARKFIAALDNFSVGSNISHRMNRLWSQKKATIIFSSFQKTNSLQESENLIKEANSIGPLEAVFFVSMTSAEKSIYNMDLASRKLDSNARFVSIFSGGLKECESRRFSGLPATVIHNNNMPRKLAAVLPQIDGILSQFDNSNSPTLYRIINADNEISETPLRNYLPHEVSTLEEIADDLSNGLKFVEVATKAPRHSTLKDCSSIFIISVLGPRPLRGLLSNLMSPAFCVTISTCNDSVIELASKLYKSLNDIENKAGVNLVSETWSSPIALEMIKLLEQDNRKYKLFILDGNPLVWKQRVTALEPIDSSQFENYLIGELFDIHPQIKLESLFGLNKPLAEKLSDFLLDHNYPPVNISNLIKIIHSLRRGLEIISKYEYENKLLKNVVLLDRHFNENQSLNISLTSELHVHQIKDYFKFLSSSQVRDDINRNVVYNLWCD